MLLEPQGAITLQDECLHVSYYLTHPYWEAWRELWCFLNTTYRPCTRHLCCPASLTMRRYQFNPHLLHPETVTNVLVKALTVFPSPAYSLCLALLPASTIPFGTDVASIPTTDLTESIQKLTKLNAQLESAQYDAFWSTLESDDLYADLYADIAGFEDLIRIRIAGEVGKTFREIELEVLSRWLNLRSEALVKFCQTACGWQVNGDKVSIPANSENEAKSEIKGERVDVDMFGRVFRRGYEAPA
jgi:translation initiation factor 3 subunit K